MSRLKPVTSENSDSYLLRMVLPRCELRHEVIDSQIRRWVRGLKKPSTVLGAMVPVRSGAEGGQLGREEFFAVFVEDAPVLRVQFFVEARAGRDFEDADRGGVGVGDVAPARCGPGFPCRPLPSVRDSAVRLRGGD
jgi:hypothetical protein